MTKLRHHCCELMDSFVNERCEEHPDPFDCPDRHIYYSARFDEYGLITHDRGESYRVIQHCPWCGTRLPESRRDEWFNALAALGFDNPSEQSVPEKFLSEAWYSAKNEGKGEGVKG